MCLKKINMGIHDEFLVFKSVQGLSKGGKDVLDHPFQGMTLACVAMKFIFICLPFFETAR